MNSNYYEKRNINFACERERNALQAFLATQGLTLEPELDYGLLLIDCDEIIACGCAARNVLKCIAVADSHKGEALTNRIITDLRMRAYHEGYERLFLYTKPENKSLFSGVGFHLLATAPDVILMENCANGWRSWIETLYRPESEEETGVLVMNCNPFTLGHRHLIEEACSRHQLVHLFILEEESGSFTFQQRFELVRRGCADLSGLSIHPGGPYLISRATFPTYFLKDEGRIDNNHAHLDLDLFVEKIAPVLNIKTRYVGEEPFCAVTRGYNEVMKKLLPEKGVSVVEIPRKKIEDQAISATQVRRAFMERRLEEVKGLIPSTTYDFLKEKVK